MSTQDLIKQNIEKIKKVTGDFRQEEIIADWASNQRFQSLVYSWVAKVQVEISRGMYVRSLSQDISKKLKTIGFVKSLVRTKNGEYTQKECDMIIQP